VESVPEYQRLDKESDSFVENGLTQFKEKARKQESLSSYYDKLYNHIKNTRNSYQVINTDIQDVFQSLLLLSNIIKSNFETDLPKRVSLLSKNSAKLFEDGVTASSTLNAGINWIRKREGYVEGSNKKQILDRIKQNWKSANNELIKQMNAIIDGSNNVIKAYKKTIESYLENNRNLNEASSSKQIEYNVNVKENDQENHELQEESDQEVLVKQIQVWITTIDSVIGIIGEQDAQLYSLPTDSGLKKLESLKNSKLFSILSCKGCNNVEVASSISRGRRQ